MSEKSMRRNRRNVNRIANSLEKKTLAKLKKSINQWKFRDRVRFAWKALRGKL
ncbi:MAG: hypothetical protein KDK41_17690 [Leptospiraceae bacterium]|nr:hypothetical protein [Leptospiraceae bacterium]